MKKLRSILAVLMVVAMMMSFGVSAVAAPKTPTWKDVTGSGAAEAQSWASIAIMKDGEWLNDTEMVEGVEKIMGVTPKQAQENGWLTCGEFTVAKADAIYKDGLVRDENQEIVQVVLKVEHKYGDKPTSSRPAGCETKGEEIYSCEYCGETKKVELKATGHHYVYVSQDSEPTCTEAGILYEMCDNENHEGDPFTGNTREVEALGHIYDDYEAIAPTCYSAKFDRNAKTSELFSYNGKLYFYGKFTEICSRCGEEGKTSKFDFDQWAEEFELDPEEVEFDSHNWNYEDMEVVEPTCVKNGYVRMSCNHCYAVYEEVIPATGHDYEFKGIESVDCYTAQNVYECTVCHKTFKGYMDENGELVLNGSFPTSAAHKYPTVTQWVNDDGMFTADTYNMITKGIKDNKEQMYKEAKAALVSSKAPSCEAEGVMVFKCLNDDKNHDAETYLTIRVEPIGHQWSDWADRLIDDPNDPDYASHIHEYSRTCSVCGKTEVVTKEYAKEFKECAKDGHNYSNKIYEPTCTKDGYTLRTCADCGNTIKIPGKKAVGHDFEVKTARAATCEEEGLEVKICKVCGTIELATAPAKGHTIEIDPAVAPTKDKPGKTEGAHCSVCGKVIVAQQEIPAVGENTYKINAKDIKVDGNAVSGMGIVEVTGIDEVPALYARVSYFYDLGNDQTLGVVVMQPVVKVGNDYKFSMSGVAPLASWKLTRCTVTLVNDYEIGSGAAYASAKVGDSVKIA